MLDSRFILHAVASVYHDTRRSGVDGLGTLELLRKLDSSGTQAVLGFTRGTQSVTLEDVGNVVDFGVRTAF